MDNKFKTTLQIVIGNSEQREGSSVEPRNGLCSLSYEELNEASNCGLENSKSPSLLFKHYENKQIKRQSHCKIVKKALFVIGSVFAVAAIAFFGTAGEESTERTLTSTVMPSTPRPVSTNGMQIEGALKLLPKDYSALDGRFPVPTFKRDDGERAAIQWYKSLAGMVYGYDIERKSPCITEEPPTELLLTLVPRPSLLLKSKPIRYTTPQSDDYDDDDDEEYGHAPASLYQYIDGETMCV